MREMKLLHGGSYSVGIYAEHNVPYRLVPRNVECDTFWRSGTGAIGRLSYSVDGVQSHGSEKLEDPGGQPICSCADVLIISVVQRWILED